MSLWHILWNTGWWIADPFWRGVWRGYVRGSLLLLPLWTGLLVGHWGWGWPL